MSAEFFGIENSHLIIEGVDVIDLAERYGTPLYVTSRGKLESNITRFQRAFSEADLYYAVKANNNLSIMKIIAEMGFGADVFSDGELYLALIAGFNRDKILFNGNSKNDDDIKAGISAGVTFSVDSLDELEAISEMAKDEINIAFRVNPDVSPQTHPKIATGLRESKFGIPWEQIVNAYRKALETKNIRPVGIHCHIGSQIMSVDPFIEALNRMFDVAIEVEKLGVDLEFLDMGGGIGIPYKEGENGPSLEVFSAKIFETFEERGSDLKSSPTLILEPGRSIVGDTTVLITKVNAVKRAFKNFVAVDAGFNLLIRPAFYGSYHRIVVANKMDEEPVEKYTVVGPICETGDILAEDRKLPEVKRGDYIAIFDTGAYGFAMSSQYNGRLRCAEVMVSGRRSYLIRERENYSDLVGRQVLPFNL
jgi:diaminopimelate decarboxylase